MKKILIITLTLIMASTFIACSNNDNSASSNNQNSNQTTEVTASPEREKVEGYKLPADVVEIDLNVDNPSTDKITFKYDEQGRISQCNYKVDNTDILLSYSYDEKSIHIFGYSGSIIVADETFEGKADYDNSAKFTEYNGYYFKGFVF